MAAPQQLAPQLIGNGLTFLLNRARTLAGPVRGYVVLDIKGAYPERRPQQRPIVMRVVSRARDEDSVEALTERLDLIAGDPRIDGAVLRVGHLGIDLATADSLRMAIERFRARGKRAVAYLASDIDLRSYYVASAADEVLAAESGHFMVTGLGIQVQFMKDALSRWGIQADMEAMGEYKSAAEPFMRSDISEANREMLDSLLDAQYAAITEGIAQSRRLTPERVRELMDAAPFSIERARDERLIDGVLYEDALPAHLGSADAPATLTPWRSAGLKLIRPYRPAPAGVVSVISVRGAIVPGESRDIPVPVPFVGGLQAGSETVVRALRKAERDPSVKAIVCHIDSPGGSALASDLIWHEVRRVNERKPVVAYMDGVAASGGYYVAAGARHIVAHPQTLTGSIGVLGGKLVVQDLYKKAGIRPVLLTRGQRAALFTGARPFEDGEREAVRGMLGDVYTRFKDRVAQGRKMGPEAVEERARGRVWTGRQALEQGLVDELGDLHVAVERAKSLAGVDASAYVRVADIAPPSHYTPPSLNPAHALTDLVDSARRLNREAVWAWMPWTVTIE